MAGVSLPTSLEAARIDGLPAAAYYVPDFISGDEERLLLDKIVAAPKPKWKQLAHRRLQTWPSDLVRDRLLDAPLPRWLEDPVVPRLLQIPRRDDDPQHLFAQSPHARPNHVLVNEYPAGVGIIPHKDGPAYWPVVCTVSLGASLCLHVHRGRADGTIDPTPCWRILQEPRSLLFTTESLYTDHLHGIADVREDVELCAERVANWSLLGNREAFCNGVNVRGTRISLTYRDVLKVSRIGNKVGMFSQP